MGWTARGHSKDKEEGGDIPEMPFSIVISIIDHTVRLADRAFYGRLIGNQLVKSAIGPLDNLHTNTNKS